MLAADKNVVIVQVSQDVADNYVLKHLTADAGQGYRPIVTGFGLFTLLVDCRDISCSPYIGNLSCFKALLVDYAKEWGYLN